jgi:acetyl esterase
MSLDPALRVFLDQLAAMGQPSPFEQTPEQVREAYNLMTVLGSRPENRPSSQDRHIPGPQGDIPVRLYRPEVAGPLPIVVFFHGGGWSIGSIETHEPMCEQFAVQVPAVVVSVDYRLAPEHPYPAAVEDCFAATAWTAAHASEIGGDPSRLAVAGDSSGGNLAAVVCLKARDAGGPPIAFQLLLYPATDLVTLYPSYVENGEGYFLTSEIIQWFVGNYVPDDRSREPHASPLFAEQISGLPPALIVTAGFDPLRDQGEIYAERLREAGVQAAALRYDSMIHGFFQLDDVVPAAHEAIQQTATSLREALNAVEGVGGRPLVSLHGI